MGLALCCSLLVARAVARKAVLTVQAEQRRESLFITSLLQPSIPFDSTLGISGVRMGCSVCSPAAAAFSCWLTAAFPCRLPYCVGVVTCPLSCSQRALH